jgi:BMFP domain-containing protein YqiC
MMTMSDLIRRLENLSVDEVLPGDDRATCRKAADRIRELEARIRELEAQLATAIRALKAKP